MSHIYLLLCNSLQSVNVFCIRHRYSPYWWAHNWTQHSRCGLVSGEQRRRIPSPDLLARFFLMQPGMLLALFDARALCQLMFNLKTPRSFSEKLLPSSSVHSTYWFPGTWLDVCLYWTPWGFCLTMIRESSRA